MHDNLTDQIPGAIRDDQASGLTRVPRMRILEVTALCRIADTLDRLTED